MILWIWIMELGLAKGKVALGECHLQAKELANRVIERLKPVFPGAEFAHVGSTAIPNIKAKPIADIAVCLSDLSLAKAKRDELELLGLIFRGEDVPNQILYAMENENGESIAFVHFCQKGDSRFEDYLFFRDFLSSHPEKAKEYGELKESLAKRFPNERKNYTAGKAEFFDSILSLRVR